MEQYVTYNGKEGSGVITTLTKGKQYKIIEDLETSICIRNDRGQKKYYYRQYFTDTPSPAKAEQEGPWKYEVHHEARVAMTGCSGGEYVTVTDGKVVLYADVNEGEEFEGEVALCQVLNKFNIKLDYDHESEMVAEFLEKELKRASALQREQEGLRWVKLEDYKFTPWETVCAKWEPQPGNSRRSCCYRSPDGIITWIGEKPREKVKVYILDESTTPPVKEAPQPYLQVIQNFTLSDIDSPTFTHTEDFRKHFDYIKKKLMEAIKESHPHTAGDFMSFVGKELKDKQQSSLSKEEELIYRIVEQWGNAMCSMDEMVQWLKDYSAESRQQPAEKGAVWVDFNENNTPYSKGHYYVEYNTGNKGTLGWDNSFSGLVKYWLNSVKRWLDESGLASSREREVAIGFLDWIRDETICDGAPKIFHKESKKRVTHEEALNLYLQSTNNK